MKVFGSFPAKDLKVSRWSGLGAGRSHGPAVVQAVPGRPGWVQVGMRRAQVRRRGVEESEEEGEGCIGRARQPSRGFLAGRWLGTSPPVRLRGYAAHTPILVTTQLDIILLKQPFLGVVFHLPLAMKMSCCGVSPGQRLSSGVSQPPLS